MQISAYLDNVFDVAALMEDSETKTAALEKVTELEDELGHVSCARRSSDKSMLLIYRPCCRCHMLSFISSAGMVSRLSAFFFNPLLFQFKTHCAVSVSFCPVCLTCWRRNYFFNFSTPCI